MKIILIITTLLAFSTAEDSTLVHTSKGSVRGVRNKSLNGKDFVSFLGIPYAKPPIGDLRLKEPVPSDTWEGILEGDKYKAMCPQFDMGKSIVGLYEPTGNEDCLYLNVHTPKIDKKAKLPVMVFIHGGGFVAGGSETYPPDALLNKDIVLVTIQYRLGVLGFLSTGDDKLPGNYGLMDQIQALKWVKTHIGNFGGNREQVTIFGESAGGASVSYLILSPKAQGLFNGAIPQSGTALDPWAITRQAKESATAFGEIIGCPLNNCPYNDFINCIRNKDVKDLINATSQMTKWGNIPLTFVPRVDGVVIPDEPIRLLKEGKYNKVNVMTGVTRHDGAIWLLAFLQNEHLMDSLIENIEEFGPYLFNLQEEKNPSYLLKVFLKRQLGQRKLTAENIMELIETLTVWQFSYGNSIASVYYTKDQQHRVYEYELDWVGQLSFSSLFGIPKMDNLVLHADDLFYLFSGGELFSKPLENEEDLKLQDIMVNLWTNFAATGNPTPDDSMGFIWESMMSRGAEIHHLSLSPYPYMERDNIEQMKKWYLLPTFINQLLTEKNKTPPSSKAAPPKTEL